MPEPKAYALLPKNSRGGKRSTTPLGIGNDAPLCYVPLGFTTSAAPFSRASSERPRQR